MQKWNIQRSQEDASHKISHLLITAARNLPPLQSIWHFPPWICKWEIPGWCVLDFCLTLSQHHTPGIKGTEPSTRFSTSPVTVCECTVLQSDRSSLGLTLPFGEVDECYAFDYICAKVSTEEQASRKIWASESTRKQSEKSQIAKSNDISEGWVLLFNSLLRWDLISAVQLCKMLLCLWFHPCGLNQGRGHCQINLVKL